MGRFIDELHLLNAIHLAVVATDTDGVIVFANDAAARLWDSDAGTLLDRHIQDLVTSTENETESTFDLAPVLEGTTWRGDLALCGPNDDTLLATVSAAPLLGADGHAVGAVVVAEDMTEVRHAEAEAAASEQRLRLAHQAAELGTWHWSMATGDVVWDEQLEAIYGMAPGSFGRTFEAWVATVHPDDQAEVLSTVQEAMEARSSYVLANRIFWPDGTPRWIEAHGKVTVDDQGNPTGTIGCVRDVTERMRVQEREAAAAARALLLQEVTAGFVRAWTLDQVETVLAASLERVREILPEHVELKLPDALLSISDGTAFVAGLEEPLDVEDLQLLDTLASQCAIAAERARLYYRTADIADQLQSSLAASPLPAMERFHLAVHYAPGGDELEHVGGDWYDAVATPDGTLALVVGDVMGRGVRAATTMVRVRAGIRGLLTVDPAPQAVLAAADEMVARDAPDQFVTAAALLVDPETREVSLCNAGHIPVIAVHPDGRTEALGAGSGMPLGVLDRLDRTTTNARLESGSLLVLVTDGVVESRHHDLDRGIDRLRERAAELRDHPLSDLVRGLAELADPSLRDDVTVLAARVK
jgi:PAS domain S-box-containing protein